MASWAEHTIAAFQAALAGGPDSPAARWFRRDPASGEYATFEDHHQLVALDHEEPEVGDYVVQVMTYWLDRGAAGWRLDAAYAVSASFWSKVLPRVRESHPPIPAPGPTTLPWCPATAGPS